MTKKGTLIGTIVCLLFIAIMIPIAIFASTTNSVATKNYIKFNVVDFQGNFFIGLTGNKENNIGSINTNSLSPAQLFTAKYKVDETTQEGSYNVYSVYNSETETLVESDILNIPDVEIEFDSTHTEISYYFVFINTATNTIQGDNRAVNITTQSTTIDNNITSSWAYCVETASSATQTAFELPQTWTSTTPATANVFQVTVEPGQYIMMKYTMTIDPTLQENINTEFTITINFDSAASTGNV